MPQQIRALAAEPDHPTPSLESTWQLTPRGCPSDLHTSTHSYTQSKDVVLNFIKNVTDSFQKKVTLSEQAALV